MDLLETAIETAKEIIENATKMVADSANCEVYSFCEQFNETYHNHYIEFDDGMGSRTFDIYRKHDRERMIVVGYDWTMCSKKLSHPARYEEHEVIASVKGFSKELGNTLADHVCYVGLEAYKYEHFEQHIQ